MVSVSTHKMPRPKKLASFLAIFLVFLTSATSLSLAVEVEQSNQVSLNPVDDLLSKESSVSPVIADLDNDLEVDLYDPKDVDPFLETEEELDAEGSSPVRIQYQPPLTPPNAAYVLPPPTNKQNYPPPRPAPRHSPWQVLPGSYNKEAYGGQLYYGGRYDRHQVYGSYLNSPSHADYSQKCLKSYGQTPRLTPQDLSSAFQYAAYRINEQSKYEQGQYQAGNYINASVYSTAARHQVSAYSPASNDVLYRKQKEALFNEYASTFLTNHFCLTKLQTQYLLPTMKIGPGTGNPYGDGSCYGAYKGASKIYCTDSKYRTLDGSCNNLYHPYWGKSFVCHLRLVPAAYEDGVQKPKVRGATGYPLPSPRLISSAAHDPRGDRSYYTHIKMQWGQFVNHDITLTATSVADYRGGGIKCCGSNSYHPECFPIQLGKNDYYQGKYRKTCMNFVRSAPCPLCNLGPREQMNQATSFLDLSLVYGNSDADAYRLRSYVGGLIKTQKNRCGKDILSSTAKPWEDQCSAPVKGMMCFDAGDPRVNQHPGLQIFHNIFVRLHNHHAKMLHQVNPTWDDERLYQEARRISIAQYQHITYHEYLPILFGPTLMKYYDLDVNYGTGYTRYEPYTDPTTWNDYVIAGRFGHSQISSFFSLVGRGYNGTRPGYWLKDVFFDPKFLHDCEGDSILQGYLTDPSMGVDPWVDGDLHNYLYRVKGEPVGSDLAAFNIQRSRDHGIAPYYAYLDFCFGFKVTSWEDLAKFIPWDELHILRGLYKDWRDLELWPAVISERKFPDADVGPTGACIIGIQYYHLKYGDRYFYSHGYQTGSFTPLQLSSIKRVTTLSNLLCRTTDYVPSIQKYAFFPATGYNPPIGCSSVPDINYNLWKE